MLNGHRFVLHTVHEGRDPGDYANPGIWVVHLLNSGHLKLCDGEVPYRLSVRASRDYRVYLAERVLS